MTYQHRIHRLVRSTIVIGLLGMLLGTLALDRVNEAASRADQANLVVESALGFYGVSQTPSAQPARAATDRARVTAQEANREEAEATMLLALVAVIVPLLLLLNVMGAAFVEDENPPAAPTGVTPPPTPA